MRQTFLACVAALGSAAPFSIATAQNAPVGAPTQGQAAWSLPNPSLGTVNENNNAQTTARSGPFANPTPGTIVIHIGARVNTGFKATWSSVDQRFVTAPSATSFAAGQGINGTGVVKLAPYALNSYARLYFSADAMATNGLRYGAAIELRQNFAGAISSNTSSNASTYSSTSSIFVRRAFAYVAGDNWGILRTGNADGIIGIFDNGVTTFQYLPTNNLQNGDDYAALTPGNATVPFFFLSGAGNEYANTKVVYLSPQFGGVDFGLQYAPNTFNGYAGFNTFGAVGPSLTGTGIGTGNACSVANSGCATLSSSPGILDGARILNQTAVGARYQGKFGVIGVLAYAAYEFSGHVSYTGSTAAAVLGNTVPGGTYNGSYDGLNFGNGGVAITFGQFTVGGNVIGGRLNGQLALAPQHGAPEVAYMVGAKYVNGRFVIGVAAERGDYQGSVNLTGLSQRRGQAIDVGVGYTAAPGFTVYAEYQYDTLYQGGFNFVTSAIGSVANNNARSQGLLVGNVVNF